MPKYKGSDRMEKGYSMPKMNDKVMGHDGKVSKISCNGERYDMDRMKRLPYNYGGNPKQAFDYQW